MKTLSVVISNRNDVSMLIVTIRSCIEELRPLGHENCEIIIVDNSDLDSYQILSKCFPTGYIESGLIKVFRQDFPCIFTARETAIANASGTYIACVDSHMLIGNDMFVDLVNFMEERQDDLTVAFAHAPVNWLHQREKTARHDRDMSECELGNWGLAYDYERPITWKGMPWICRRTLWNEIGGYGALAKHRLAWGGGDMHIGIKPWMLGKRNWAVPTSPAIHIGPFPDEKQVNPNSVNPPKRDRSGKYTARDAYRLYSNSGKGPYAFGFLVSCYVIGGTLMIERNRDAIKRRFGDFIDIDEWLPLAISLGQEEKDWFDTVKCCTFEQLLEKRPWAYAS